MFYYTFTTFDCNFIPRNAEICKVSSETKNVGKAHKYRLNRHLPTYEKIIKNLYSFLHKKIMDMLKELFAYTGISIHKEYWNAYDDMNDWILQAMDKND